MGACGSKPTPDDDRSRQHDQTLAAEKKKHKDEVKLLLLGAGESGKSTIFKQMKIIHQNGFDEDERRQFKGIVCMNTIQSIKALIRGAEKLGIAMDGSVQAVAQELLNLPVTNNITREVGDKIKSVWSDSGVQAAFKRSNEFQLNDSAEYYFNRLDAISEPDYVPTQIDVLMSRVKTTGIVETEFDYGSTHFRMFDVGGQRNERRKWIHHFDGVTAVVFVTSLSEYDQTLYEDEATNRMKESLFLFDEICNSEWFKKTSIILFLNKSDIFEKKIAEKDLSLCFPDYKGGQQLETAVTYIKDQFLKLNKQPEKPIYHYVTCATRTDQVQRVFESVKDTIINRNLSTLI